MNDGSYMLDEASLRRLGAIARRVEDDPAASIGFQSGSAPPAAGLEVWAQATSTTTVTVGSSTVPLYPGKAYLHTVWNNEGWTQLADNIFLHAPNGETLTLDEYYRCIGCGFSSDTAGNTTMTFDAIVPGGGASSDGSNGYVQFANGSGGFVNVADACPGFAGSTPVDVVQLDNNGNPYRWLDNIGLLVTLNQSTSVANWRTGVADGSAFVIVDSGLNALQNNTHFGVICIAANTSQIYLGAQSGSDTVSMAGTIYLSPLANGEVPYYLGTSGIQGNASFTFSGDTLIIGTPSTAPSVQIGCGTFELYKGDDSSDSYALMGGESNCIALFGGGSNGSGASCRVLLCSAAGATEINAAVDAQVGAINANVYSGFSVNDSPGVTGSFVAGSATVTVANGLVINIAT